MGPFIYYLLIKPFSLLPIPVLHGTSSLLYFLLYHLIGYRKKVVHTNLVNSFPDKSPDEVEKIMRRFYLHFCDLFVESIKMFSISEKEAVNRCRFKNPEVLEKFYQEGRDIVLIAGHYLNWELAAVCFAPQTDYKALGIYQPLRSAYFNEKAKASRGKYGLVLVPKNDTRDFFPGEKGEPTCLILIADQSPTFSKKVYWTTFLNQETAVAFGPEKFAKEFNSPAIFARIIRLRRGYSEIEFDVITDDPVNTAHGEITEAHTRLVEEQILEDPAYWLWTHKRWKRKRGEEG